MRVAVVGLAMLVLSSCGGDDGADATTAVSTARATKPPTTTPKRPKPARRTPGVGGAWNYETFGGDRITVRLTRLIDPLRLTAGEQQLFGTKARYVAVKLRFDNDGEKRYDGYISINTYLFTTKGRKVRPVILNLRHCSSPSLSAPGMGPGRYNVGCVAFRLGRRERAKRLEYQSADAPATLKPARWNLRRR